MGGRGGAGLGSGGMRSTSHPLLSSATCGHFTTVRQGPRGTEPTVCVCLERVVQGSSSCDETGRGRAWASDLERACVSVGVQRQEKLAPARGAALDEAHLCWGGRQLHAARLTLVRVTFHHLSSPLCPSGARAAPHAQPEGTAWVCRGPEAACGCVWCQHVVAWAPRLAPGCCDSERPSGVWRVGVARGQPPALCSFAQVASVTWVPRAAQGRRSGLRLRQCPGRTRLCVEVPLTRRLIPSADQSHQRSSKRQTVFGVVTAIDLLNFVASRERDLKTKSAGTVVPGAAQP